MQKQAEQLVDIKSKSDDEQHRIIDQFMVLILRRDGHLAKTGSTTGTGTCPPSPPLTADTYAFFTLKFGAFFVLKSGAIFFLNIWWIFCLKIWCIFCLIIWYNIFVLKSDANFLSQTQVHLSTPIWF